MKNKLHYLGILVFGVVAITPLYSKARLFDCEKENEQRLGRPYNVTDRLTGERICTYKKDGFKITIQYLKPQSRISAILAKLSYRETYSKESGFLRDDEIDELLRANSGDSSWGADTLLPADWYVWGICVKAWRRIDGKTKAYLMNEYATDDTGDNIKDATGNVVISRNGLMFDPPEYDDILKTFK